MSSRAVAALAAAIGLASSPCALAEPMSKAEFQAARKNIESDFKGAKGGCEPMRDNVKDICLADVTGREAIALAELEAVYQPGPKTREDLRIARAQAGYALAREMCDDKAANAKDACLKEAEAANVVARADARAQLTTAEANAAAGEKIADARKCEALAGESRALCLSEARKLHGKP